MVVQIVQFQLAGIDPAEYEAEAGRCHLGTSVVTRPRACWPVPVLRWRMPPASTGSLAGIRSRGVSPPPHS